jgi:hypothetical protein
MRRISPTCNQKKMMLEYLQPFAMTQLWASGISEIYIMSSVQVARDTTKAAFRCTTGFPPILLGMKERKGKDKKSKRKKRRGLVSIASTGHPLDSNLDKCHPLRRRVFDQSSEHLQFFGVLSYLLMHYIGK